MNDNWNDILEYWSESNLVRTSSKLIEDSDLPYDTKEFFKEVGVVKSSSRLVQSLGFDFDLLREDKLCSLSNYYPGHDDALGEMKSWIVIGHCFEQLLCIDSENGKIVLLDGNPLEGFLKWFVNSSASLLMYCITKSIQCFENSANSNKRIKHYYYQNTNI